MRETEFRDMLDCYAVGLSEEERKNLTLRLARESNPSEVIADLLREGKEGVVAQTAFLLLRSDLPAIQRGELLRAAMQRRAEVCEELSQKFSVNGLGVTFGRWGDFWKNEARALGMMLETTDVARR